MFIFIFLFLKLLLQPANRKGLIFLLFRIFDFVKELPDALSPSRGRKLHKHDVLILTVHCSRINITVGGVGESMYIAKLLSVQHL